MKKNWKTAAVVESGPEFTDPLRSAAQLASNRRQLLKSGLSAVAVGALSVLGQTDAALALPSKEYRLKLSLAAYSFNRLFRQKKFTMDEFIEYCKDRNLEGTELTSYYFESEETAYFRRLKLKCYRLGLDVSGTAVGNNFAQPDRQLRRKEVEAVKGWIDKAHVLAAPGIRVFGGGRFPEGYTERDAFNHVIPAMKECVEYAERRDILLAIENHGFPGTAEQIIEIIRQIDSAWFGACLDTGNFRTRPYEQMKAVAPYAFMVQLKTGV